MKTARIAINDTFRASNLISMMKGSIIPDDCGPRSRSKDHGSVELDLLVVVVNVVLAQYI